MKRCCGEPRRDHRNVLRWAVLRAYVSEVFGLINYRGQPWISPRLNNAGPIVWLTTDHMMSFFCWGRIKQL